MISSGCAAWPEEDITYCAFSSADEAGVPVDDCGNVDGSVLYVYGSVVAVGKETNGETVSGTCARRGWGPVRSQCLQRKGDLGSTHDYHASSAIPMSTRAWRMIRCLVEKNEG